MSLRQQLLGTLQFHAEFNAAIEIQIRFQTQFGLVGELEFLHQFGIGKAHSDVAKYSAASAKKGRERNRISLYCISQFIPNVNLLLLYLSLGIAIPQTETNFAIQINTACAQDPPV